MPLGLHLFASLFLCTYQFSLSRGSSSIVVWLCRSASADFLFAYLPRLNQHTLTHTKSNTVHTRSHKGLNHPTLSCLALHTSKGQVLSFPAFPELQPTHCMCDFFCCHLTRGMPHLSTQWANPPASPCPLNPTTSLICLVAVLRLFMFIC